LAQFNWPLTANTQDQPLQLAIDPQGAIALNKQNIANLISLEAVLKSELLKNKDVALHLYADQTVLYKRIAEVMATVQHAGIAKIAFVTIEQ
jgi:biopolymer transport protein TolR